MSDPRYNENMSNSLLRNINNGRLTEEPASTNRNNPIAVGGSRISRGLSRDRDLRAQGNANNGPP